MANNTSSIPADSAEQSRDTLRKMSAHKLTLTETGNGLHPEFTVRGDCSCGWQCRVATQRLAIDTHAKHVENQRKITAKWR